jgi:hypothetical protein
MNNNYKLKYYKYKNKYLALKGGVVPTYNKREEEPISMRHILPYERTRDNIILNPTTYNYEITDKVFSKMNMLNFLESTIVINETTEIPFEILFMQDSFGILGNLKKLLKYYFTLDVEHTIIDTQFNKFFVFDENNEYITLSSNSNILTKYILLNKIVEFLKILYDNLDERCCKERISSLYGPQDTLLRRQNILDVADLVSLYKNFIKGTSPEKLVCRSTRNISSSSEIIKEEVAMVKELKGFIEMIDSNEQLNGFLGINPSLLFFASYIGERINNPMLTRGGISNKLFPINLYNLTCNLLQVPITTELIFVETPKLTKLQKYFSSSDLPTTYNFSQSTYRDNNYPDCVETALLLFVRCLFYNISTKSYDTSLLVYYPTINPLLVDLIRKLTTENENSETIKNEFSSIVSNIPCVKYKNENYEIISSIENATIVLNYLFNSEQNVKGVIKSTDITQIKEIIFNENGIVSIKYKNQNINIKFANGHASSGYSKRGLLNYKYKDLIILLTNKYYIYDDLKFNIYNSYFKRYIDAKIEIPKYLNFLMLNDNLYFIGDNDMNNDFNNIVYNHLEILEYIKKMNTMDVINICIKSRLLEKLLIVLFIAETKGQKFPREITKFLKVTSSYEIPKTLFSYINENYFNNTSTFNDIYTLEDFSNQLLCIISR